MTGNAPKNAGRRRLLALASVAGGAVMAGTTAGAGITEVTGGEPARALGDRRSPSTGTTRRGSWPRTPRTAGSPPSTWSRR
jgi:hypothetical protein